MRNLLPLLSFLGACANGPLGIGPDTAAPTEEVFEGNAAKCVAANEAELLSYDERFRLLSVSDTSTWQDGDTGEDDEVLTKLRFGVESDDPTFEVPTEELYPVVMNGSADWLSDRFFRAEVGPCIPTPTSRKNFHGHEDLCVRAEFKPTNEGTHLDTNYTFSVYTDVCETVVAIDGGKGKHFPIPPKP